MMQQGHEPSPGRQIRDLIRASDRAVLATHGYRDGPASGEPYASLVLVACHQDATPLLLTSRLADHTKNLLADPSLSLLFDGTAGLAEPLTGPRASVQGRAIRDDSAAARARFLARHPSAARYAGFGDFAFHRVEIRAAHIVAGFGRIHWVDAAAVRDESGDAHALIDAATGIVTHMNEDHADAVTLYATRLLGRAGEGWRMTGIDPEGCDLRRDGEIARLVFDQRVTTAAAARATLVTLVNRARTAAP
jgi:putative heme iron utilization protein